MLASAASSAGGRLVAVTGPWSSTPEMSWHRAERSSRMDRRLGLDCAYLVAVRVEDCTCEEMPSVSISPYSDLAVPFSRHPVR